MKPYHLYIFWFARNQCLKLRIALLSFRILLLKFREAFLEYRVFLLQIGHGHKRVSWPNDPSSATAPKAVVERKEDSK